MEFVPAVKRAFQLYFTFSGRASRSEYWYFWLFYVGATFVTNLIDAVLGSYLSLLFSLATTIPSVSLACRRLHDVGRSGWWQLVWVTVIGIIPLVYWLCSQGNEKGDRFGPPPAHTN